MFTTVSAALLAKHFIQVAQPSAQLDNACLQELGAKPAHVVLAVAPAAQPLRCFWNVAAHVADNGGYIVFGWSIYEWPHVFWEAQHHAIWRDPSGNLVDITPPAAKGANHTVFVEDVNSGFDLEDGFSGPEETQRFPYVAWSELYSYSTAGDSIRMRRRALDRPGAHSNDASLANFESIQRTSKEALLLRLANTLSPNAKCVCGSGTSFSSCCRANFSE